MFMPQQSVLPWSDSRSTFVGTSMLSRSGRTGIEQSSYTILSYGIKNLRQHFLSMKSTPDEGLIVLGALATLLIIAVIMGIHFFAH